MSQFIDYVKTIYKASEVERDMKVVKWPPTPSTVYINLACINRKSVSGKSREYAEITEAMVRDGNVDVIHTTKGPIEFAEIAKGISIPSGELTHSEQKRVILVEGAPGVGKSTFALEFCRRWERGEIAHQYQLVLLLRLRDESISRAESLRHLIHHPLESVSQAVSEELTLSHNFHALIILEGFDELPVHHREERSSIFFQLIAGKLLPQATVLVTSRPWATWGIRFDYEERIYQHIEILGFTSNQITEYINRTLPQDMVSDLNAYLEKHPQIRMGMYIPLNSAIVVTVYQESQETGCALPTTLTELYTAMARTLLLRYLHGHSEYETVTMHTFNDLPLAVYTKFSELCKLAYKGIVGNSYHVQLIFTGLPSNFDSLGLMDSVTELYVTRGAVASHNFLHLTFQEYFAAVHMSTLSSTEQLKHFKIYKEGRLKVVLRFLAGLNQLSCFSKGDVHHFLEPSSGESSSPYCMPVDVGVTTDLVNWMFEAQSNDVIALLLEKKTVEFRFTQYMLPLDYYCLGYCIAHSQCQWVFSIEGDGTPSTLMIGKKEVRMVVAGASTTQEPSGKVVGLRIGECEMSVDLLHMLFAEWKSVLHLHQLALRLPAACDSITWPDLAALRALSLGISGETTWRLKTLLPHLSLESLTLHAYGTYVSLVLEDGMAIADHIMASKCLKKLCFTYKNPNMHEKIDDKAVEAIAKALAGNPALPLEGLELNWKCSFTDTAEDSLAQFISNTTTLQWLRIWRCTFCTHGLSEPAVQMTGEKHQPGGRVIRLMNKDYRELSVKVLNALFTKWKSVLHVHELALRLPAACDSITWPDLAALRVLSLGISGRTTWRLETLLPHLSLESLTITCINAGRDDGLVLEDSEAIVDYINSTTCLKELCFVCDKGVGFVVALDKGLEAITKALTSNQLLPLERLKLEWKCTFTDTTADYLAQFISNTTTLQYFRMQWCMFSAHRLLQLARAVHNNSTLQEKSLECLSCTVNGDDEAKDFSQLLVEYPQVGLRYNHRITINRIGNVGAIAIAQALHHNSTLKLLKLSNNSINDAGAVALAWALHHNSTLEWLKLSNNSINNAGAVALAQALHHNSTLEWLKLSNNSINDAGAVALGQALHHNRTLTWLKLSNNSINDAGAVALGQALHHNHTLKWLRLSNNSINNAGAVALAQALHHNSTLEWLKLSNNSINDAGAVALGQALHHNRTLTWLKLSNNSINDAGAVALAQALHRNRTLQILDLSNNNISDTGIIALAQVLHHNSRVSMMV